MNFYIGWMISLCCGIGLLFLEYYLSKKKQWYAGMIPMLLVFALFAGLNVHSGLQIQKQQNLTDSYEMKNGMRAEIHLKQDENRKVIAFSNLLIKDQEDILRDEAGISYQTEKTICRYQEAAECFKEKYALMGDSVSPDFVDVDGAVYENTSISRNGFLFAGLLMLIPRGLVYLCNRLIYRRERLRMELKAMGLKFL